MAVHAELDGAAAKQSNRGLGDSPSPDVDLRVLGEVEKEVNALKSSKHLKPKQLHKYRQAVEAAAAAALRQLDGLSAKLTAKHQGAPCKCTTKASAHIASIETEPSGPCRHALRSPRIKP